MALLVVMTRKMRLEEEFVVRSPTGTAILREDES
jgi:hypothetical protein